MSEIKVGDTVLVRAEIAFVVPQLDDMPTEYVLRIPGVSASIPGTALVDSLIPDAAWLAPFVALVERVGVDKVISSLAHADIALRNWRDALDDDRLQIAAQESDEDASVVSQLAAALRGEAAK